MNISSSSAKPLDNFGDNFRPSSSSSDRNRNPQLKRLMAGIERSKATAIAHKQFCDTMEEGPEKQRQTMQMKVSQLHEYKLRLKYQQIKRQQAEEQVKSLTQKVTSLIQERGTMSANTSHELSDEIQKLQSQLKSAEQENKQLNDALNKNMEIIADQEAQLKNMREERDGAQRDLDSAQDDKDALSERIEYLETQVNDKKRKRQENEQRIFQQDQRIKDLVAENSCLKKAAEGDNARWEVEKAAEKRRLEESYNKLDRLYRAAIKDTEEVEKKRRALDRENDELREELAKLKEQQAGEKRKAQEALNEMSERLNASQEDLRKEKLAKRALEDDKAASAQREREEIKEALHKAIEQL